MYTLSWPAWDRLVACGHDIRLAGRTLLKSPGFFLAAAGCLSLGIGATAAMYSQIERTIFQPVPGIANPGQLVRLQRPVSYPAFEQLAGSFADSAVFAAPVPLLVAAGEERPERVWGQFVSAGYFALLGVQPWRGRLFSAAEERHFGASRSCIVSHRLWRARFGEAADIAGRAITVNGQRVTIAGVTPPGFAGASPATAAGDLWLPVTSHPSLAPELATLRDTHSRTFTLIGRLPEGVGAGQAEPGLEAVLRRMEATLVNGPAPTGERLAVLLPGGRLFAVRNEDLPRAIGFPLVLVGLVLAMACGNVSHLVLARHMNRQREWAVRLSLGAGRRRLIQMCLAETAVLAVAGALGGLVLAIWFLSSIGFVGRALPGYMRMETSLHWGSLLSAVAFGTLATFFAGLFPALHATRQVDLQQALKSRGAAASSRGWFNLRHILVFQQVAASMVLLLLTGFVVIGWYRAAGRSLGYDPAGLYLVKIDPIRAGYSAAESSVWVRRVMERLREEAWVEGVSLAHSVPMAMSSGETMMGAKTDVASGSKALASVRIDSVGEGFFGHLRVPVLRGREFTAGDESGSARVVVVNQTMAQRTWPGGAALGQTLQLDDGGRWEVVGVTGDIRSAFLLSPDVPTVYRPARLDTLQAASRHGVTILVRARSGAEDAAGSVARLLDALNPRLAGSEVTPVSEEIGLAAFFTRFALMVYGGMGLFGLILACVGLAGVTAYSVARRTAEIGIRSALGATPADVLWLIAGQSARIAALGVAAGFLLALAALRALAAFVNTFSEIAGFSANDPLILLGAPALLGVVALLAAGLPALKALRIQAADALRLD